MSQQNKFKIVKNSNRCFKSFNLFHNSKNCGSKLSCFKYKNQYHHGSICTKGSRGLNTARDHKISNSQENYESPNYRFVATENANNS